MAQANQVYGGDEINAIVFDPGAAWTRIGWSAEDGPSIAYSTNYAVREGSASFGDDSTFLVKPNTEIHNPMNDSIVEDWENAKKLWKGALSQASAQRDTSYLQETPLLMTEPFWNTKESQKKAMEFVLEELKAPAFFIAKSPVLALFAAGRGSGIVIDAGAQTLSVTPVIDGICLYKPAQRSRKAGNFLNEKIKEVIGADIVPGYEIKSKTPVGLGEDPIFERKTNLPEGITENFRSFQISRVLEQFKESIVQVSETPYNAEAVSNYKPRSFEFPDSHQIQISAERYALGETLFESPKNEPKIEENQMDVDDNEDQQKGVNATASNQTKGKSKSTSGGSSTSEGPVYNDWSAKGVSALTIECLKACDVDVRANLANNIIITGGTSLTQGFTERINHDLQREFPMLKIRIFASGNMVERKNSAWIGGSILASLGTFHQLWVSQEELEEVGAEQLVYKRFR